MRLCRQIEADLPLLTGAEAPHDSNGPGTGQRTSVREPRLHDSGALTVVDDDTVLGEVSWHWQQQWGPTASSRCPMIGAWLRTEARGRGVGGAAQAELVDLLFRHTATHRVEASTDVENLAEQRALERASLRREGVVRGAQWREGRRHDMVLYGVVRTDRR